MRCFRLVTPVALLVVAACMPRPDPQRTAYVAKDGSDDLARYAPMFVVGPGAASYNRIGTPAAHRGPRGREHVLIDPAAATFYGATRRFETAKGRYTNLVYRVHFERVPLRHLTAGRNVGLFAIVTLDEARQPVLITTVHTCGCYLAVVPTTFLPADRLPRRWQPAEQHVHGESLPGMLHCPKPLDPAYRPVIVVRDDEHRVMDIRLERVTEAGWRYRVEPARLEPIEALDRLPLGQTTTSFFWGEGLRKGFVKGSRKPLEMLFMGWLAADLFVGRDKRLGPRGQAGTTFYTSLKLWRRRDSDLWDFARCLAYQGWRL